MPDLPSQNDPDGGVTAEVTSPVPAQTATEQTDTNILPPQHWAQLPEQDEQDDVDSAVFDNVSSTASLTSSILNYRTIQGRKYHSERGNAEYWGPIDDTHQEAMDINHHVLTLLLGDKLHLAPLPENINKVVDIGTGTGIWAIDFADVFPHLSVIGTDLAPTQPSWVPPNLEFQIDDCTQDWTFQDDSLDYVHMRWLVGSIKDWTALFKQAYKCLKPGGFIESFEPSSRLQSDDDSVSETSAMSQWGKFFVEGGRILGRPFTVFEDGLQKKAMQEAGFVDIEERDFKNPFGGWAKDPRLQEVGSYTQLALEQDAEGTVLYMATLLGWSKEDVTVYLAHFRRESRSKKVHPFFWQKVVWGRKPESS
ncbi:S-adenosyl-L-methionine-dependent methyltransferase [Ilyonectria sp. MPI-CAGE-AT-0026]|nr:S-adenosyl-L-methionine-dependent methyltransferase [Ilyonectria sp. MPI-CAGE-AT-0026]